jgi:hypothetical protein
VVGGEVEAAYGLEHRQRVGPAPCTSTLCSRMCVRGGGGGGQGHNQVGGRDRSDEGQRVSIPCAGARALHQHPAAWMTTWSTCM